jgi:hypothetical protein
VSKTGAPETPPLFDPARPPSSSLLFYLYAERVVPAARRGTKAPLAGVRVDTRRLACVLFAVAFWHLRELGLVGLEVAHERRGLKTSTRVRVTRASLGEDALREEGQRDGIEGGILDVLTPGSLPRRTPAWEAVPGLLKGWATWAERAGSELASLPTLGGRPNPLYAAGAIPGDGKAPAETVAEVVTAWYGADVSSPSRVPISWTEREGVAKGYLVAADAHRNPLAALFLGKTTHVPQQERIAALKPEFTQLLMRWRAFQADEAALADHLEREIVDGLDARQADSSTA